MATHSSILAWRIPWTEKSGRLQSMGHKELITTEATQHACKSILILVLILEEKLSVFHCWLWYYLWACHIWSLLCWGTFLVYLLCYFFIKKNWCLILSNIVSHIYWDDYLTFLILHFVAVAYPLTDLLMIKTSLHLWNQSCLIMVYNLFNILLNLPIFYWGCLHLMVIRDIAHNFLFLWHYDLVLVLE